MKNPEAQSISGDSLERDESEFDEDKTPLEEEVNPDGHLENLRKELGALKHKEARLNQGCVYFGKKLKTEDLSEAERKEIEEEVKKLGEELDKVEEKRAEIEEEIQQMKEAAKNSN